MATVTYIRERRQGLAAMKGVMRYCMQAQKVTDPVSGRALISGVNCDGEHAIQEFLTTKTAYRKKDGMNFYQYIQSFKSWDEISAVKAHEIALAFAARAWPGHEILVCTHCDTDNPHSHFIINSVNFGNGYKLRQNPNTLQELRQLSDELCVAHGLEIIKKASDSKLSSREFRAAQKNQSWKFQLIAAINTEMKRAGSREELIRAMRQRGYEMLWTPERKYITFTCPNGMKCRDNKLHDNKFLKENIENEFSIRKRITGEFPFGFSGAAEHRGPRADRADALSSDRLRDPAGAAGRRIQTASTGRDLPAGALSEDRTAGNEGGVAMEPAGTSQQAGRLSGTGGRAADRDQPEDHSGDTLPPRTGWEDAREIYLRQHLGAGFQSQRVGHGNLPTPPTKPLVHDRHDALLHHPRGLGIGMAAAAVGLMAEEEDPEELQKRLESKQAGENFGAALGLVAGTAIALAEKQKQKTPDMTMQGM